jgi:hypothetical protein
MPRQGRRGNEAGVSFVFSSGAAATRTANESGAPPGKRRKAMKPRSYAWCAALLLAGVAALPVSAAEKSPAAKAIDLAICLDTSNSMDGLIGSAKAKLWDIVNDLAKVKPTPNLRVALYSYGNDGYDPKAGWVRKELDFTNDLDALYQKLFALTTRGGTEYVARVCRDAAEQLKWSANQDALKIIFVCGNEPAGQDPAVKLKDAAGAAKAKGVVVNAIFCGPAGHTDARDWKEYAALCGGAFLSIDQGRGTVAVATPMDKSLAELSAKLNTTYLYYGALGKDKQLNQLAQDANAVRLGTAVAAARATSKAGGLYRNDVWDVVDRMKRDPKFDITKVPEKELCDELKKLKPAERLGYVKRKAKEREDIQKQVDKLSAKRTAYLNAEQKKHSSKADKAFDEAIRAALRTQAAAKGMQVPE